MLSVPSHVWLFFQNTAGSSCILIDLHNSLGVLQSSHDISLADPAIIPNRPFPSATTHRSDGTASHLLARCVLSSDPSARATGRYL